MIESVWSQPNSQTLPSFGWSRDKNISPRPMCVDFFPLIITHIQNIPWPREHLLLYNIVFSQSPLWWNSTASHGRLPFTKVSGKSGWKVNGTRLFGLSKRKISGSNGTSEKIVLFFALDGILQTEILVPFLQNHL